MDQVRKLLLKLYKQVGSTRAKRYASYVERGEWGLLQKQTVSHPTVYGNATLYKRDVIITDITRKLLLPGDNAKRKQNAINTFWATEAQCCATNARLHRYINNQGPFEPSDIPVLEFITRWRKVMQRALGKASYVLTPRFNPGATLTHGGKLITIPDKIRGESSAYVHSQAFISAYFRGTPLEHKPPTLFRANEYFTVPKDSEKDRGCGKEASLNVMLQLDVGRQMKTQYLKTYKVDLKRAAPIHRKLAQIASEKGHLATIDLSNASDTVCRNLVRLLLPSDWWELLNSLRAHGTKIEGQHCVLEKFSSMGNGFTFELETFIFRTLCETLGCEVAYVFGDDIVVDQHRSRDVIAALRFFGFTPNEKKTFCEGPFRESCGGDFFKGEAVRPYFLKELPDDPQKWISLANGLRRADPTFKWVGAAWRFCIDQIPISFRHYGPEALGDLVIWDPDATPVIKLVRVGCSRESRREALPVWHVVAPVTRKLALTSYWDTATALACAAYGTGPDIAFRGNVTGFRVRTVLAYGVAEIQTYLT